jgi:hypothetical protein
MADLMVALVISEVAALVLDSPLWCHSAAVAQHLQDQLWKSKQLKKTHYVCKVLGCCNSAAEISILPGWKNWSVSRSESNS